MSQVAALSQSATCLPVKKNVNIEPTRLAVMAMPASLAAAVTPATNFSALSSSCW